MAWAGCIMSTVCTIGPKTHNMCITCEHDEIVQEHSICVLNYSVD